MCDKQKSKNMYYGIILREGTSGMNNRMIDRGRNEVKRMENKE